MTLLLNPSENGGITVLVKMRVGGASNRSLGNILRKSAEDYRALKANGVGGLSALAWKNLSKLGQFFERRAKHGM